MQADTMRAPADSDTAGLGAPELDRYRADGVVVLKQAFDPFDVMIWQKSVGAAVQPSAGRPNNGRKDRFVYGVLPSPLYEIHREPRLVAIARQVLGPDVALYMNRILVKDARWNGPVAAHQDMPYFHGSTRKLSVFVPLSPFNRQTGGLSFVLGSHHYGNLGVRGTVKIADYPQLEHLTVDAAPGDAVLMDFLIWHYSEAAPVPSLRPVLQIVYQAADDGAYYGELLGVDKPTLVCGEWRTRHFSRYSEQVVPDGPG